MKKMNFNFKNKDEYEIISTKKPINKISITLNDVINYLAHYISLWKNLIS